MGGKGGVGKTTTAGALALMAAESGRSTLLVSTDPAHSLGDVFDTQIGNEETSLAPNLLGLEIDPEAEAEQHRIEGEAKQKEVEEQLHAELTAQGLDAAAIIAEAKAPPRGPPVFSAEVELAEKRGMVAAAREQG